MNTELINAPSLDFERRNPRLRSATMPSSMKLLLRLLQKLQFGTLRLGLPDGAVLQFGHGTPSVGLNLRNWKLAAAVLKSGDIGFAETFINGDWDSDDLPALMELLSRNRATVEKLIYGSWWGGLLYRLKHLARRNTRSRSRKNIHAHYDIGNDFYQLWLDPSMTYSSGWWADQQELSLEQAQERKYRRVLEQLQVAPGAKLLEIGCGWGGFAEFAAAHAAAHVTGLTLSTQQLEFAQRRLANSGLAANAELRLQDYRDVHGSFDGIASIEMFEAVGEAYWPSYFACIARHLKSGGRACIQSIVIDDALFARYRKGTDFIQQYIFPGGMLPSPSVFRQQAEQHGLQVVDELAFGADYGRSLALWRAAFHARLAEIRALGFDQRFLRIWDFYLAYCEAGFRAGSVDVMQFTLLKP